jgi:small subunit ribosomal protein S21
MSFEKALRIFRKKCDNAGIKDDVRKKEYYEKPNAKRRRVKQEAIRRKDRARAKELAEIERSLQLHIRKIKYFIINSRFLNPLFHTPPKNCS